MRSDADEWPGASNRNSRYGHCDVVSASRSARTRIDPVGSSSPALIGVPKFVMAVGDTLARLFTDGRKPAMTGFVRIFPTGPSARDGTLMPKLIDTFQQYLT
jgi:hypothetical protein